MLEFQKTKAFLLRDTCKIDQKKFLLLVKLKIQFREHYWKILRKRIAKKSRIEKVLKRKGDKLYVKWAGHDNSFGLTKTTSDKNESTLS